MKTRIIQDDLEPKPAQTEPKRPSNIAARMNWYLPKWLEWLPRTQHEKAPEAPAAPVPGS